jgi:large subunit ribosomal protein L29
MGPETGERREAVKASELRELTDDELNQRLREKYDDLMSFRMQEAAGSVDNVRGARNTRRTIARVKTILRERELASAKHEAEEAK